MERIEFKATGYPTDLTDAQWARLEVFFPQGPNSLYHKRALIDAALYRENNRCGWKALPHDFPPYFTVQTFYRRSVSSGLWEKVRFAVRER